MHFYLNLIQSLPAVNTSHIEVKQAKLPHDNQESTLIQTSTSQVAFLPGISQMSGPVFFSGLIAGLVILLLLSTWAYTKVFVITPANEGFVRTGGIFIKNKKVIINGGCVVLPGFHEITRVPLREISIDVERTNKLAVRTQDYLRANMRVTFYVCVQPNQEDVLAAAAKLSKDGVISENNIKEAIEKRADDAIRAAAKKKSIAEIDSDKVGFADEVFNQIQHDLKKVGLTLNNIAISEIEESDTYDENNFFDAQGVRLRTETIQRSIQQKREVELSTKVSIEQRELDAEKQSLEIARQKEDAKLTQQKEIALLQAEREREIQASKDQEIAKIEKNKLLQRKNVEEEKINQELAVQASKIQADISLEEKNKELKLAQTKQRQEAEIAEITRQQTVAASQLRAQVEVAEAEQESKIAQQAAAVAITQKETERLAAEAEKAEAQSAVETATQVEKAEREKRLSIITAEREAEQKRISDQNVVELDVFRRRRQAEIARQAAEFEAQSIRTLAEANRYQAMAEAEGKRALIAAENTLNNANRTAELIKSIWPELAPQLPEIVKHLAPQPGVLGDARIYAFPGLNGGSNGNGKQQSNSMGDVSKLLWSTSGLSLINSLMSEGKLVELIAMIPTLLNSPPQSTNVNNSYSSKTKTSTPETEMGQSANFQSPDVTNQETINFNSVSDISNLSNIDELKLKDEPLSHNQS